MPIADPERAGPSRAPSRARARLRRTALRALLGAAVACLVGGAGGVSAQAPARNTVPGDTVPRDTFPPDPNLGRRPPLGACALGARLGAAREEGACVRTRLTLLPPAPRVRTYLPVQDGSLRATPVEVRAGWRSAYPADRHDGMLWSGRGLSGSASGGLDARWRWIRVVVAPEVAWSANRPFAVPDTLTPGWSPYADPWNTPGLDRYLRPGERAVRWWGWGDSWVEGTVGPARLGLSTERLWWGPARRYPLLFSGTAGGFAHLYAETDGEVALGPGGVTLRLLGGRLRESGWFDADAGNDRHLVAAGQAAWRVGFVPGLEVALSAVRHAPPDAGGGADLPGSTLRTFAFRLAFPDEGMEAYGEVGWGELFTNGIRGVTDPEHAQVYTLGMTRSDISAGGLHWRFWGELTKQSLELPQPGASGVALALRTPALPHGHTNRGQLLGSWIGPGSNAQAVGVDFPGDAGSLGFFAERVRRDDDTYYRVHTINYGVFGYDLEWTLGARGARTLQLGPGGTLQLHAEGGVSRRKNRSFVGLDRGSNWTWVREWNRWMDLRLVWVPE